ncbi:MAG: hypothetical protein WC495_07250 [Patescibacteria group bacterium]|jgi:hypothetical protein
MKFTIVTENLLIEETVNQLRSNLSQISKEIKSTYDVELRTYIEPKERGSQKKNRVFIEWIKALRPGAAAFAMQKFCEWADQNGITLGLKASDDFGTNKEKLISFYNHFNFIPIISEMEREPK